MRAARDRNDEEVSVSQPSPSHPTQTTLSALEFLPPQGPSQTSTSDTKRTIRAHVTRLQHGLRRQLQSGPSALEHARENHFQYPVEKPTVSEDEEVEKARYMQWLATQAMQPHSGVALLDDSRDLGLVPRELGFDMEPVLVVTYPPFV